ncbi:IS21-like element helper ATPase IstB [Flagellimonas okinawensis]|uniref:IS21-like element helper ATPase IstB n=1 Tax=Flagellimonas okinawensis TaxID=3031324 RepID=A0ABT5XTB8_9FLAO|nr:IS21-like element helper ATPase IstB [[Muricauda] okinawensis]MDF0709148.1 IS21-like element helper ATPase IstB [[Muricauda] okinawensis]
MNEKTMQLMKEMRLYGMHRAFTTTMETGGPSTGYTNDELIAYLVQNEWDDRHNRRIERLTKSARFRYTAVMEAIDYRPSRQLDKNLVRRLGSCGFIQKRENILITGSTGVGKSYLASAIGHQACTMGSKTMYFNTAKLFTLLKTSKADGSYPKQISKLEKQDLLILDDFGLKPLDNINRHALMEIIEDRHGKKSTIIASQLPVSKWHDIIGERTLADAILDRLVHTAHRIDIKGESMRRKLKNKN